MQEKRFARLGGSQSIALAARVISSSNGDLESVRRDLLYRINVVTITLPPLRERREDIPRLVRSFAGGRTFTAAATRALQDYSWPGNVRELRNVIERAALMTDDKEIDAGALALDRSAPALVDSATRNRWTLDELESHYIREVLRVTKDNQSKAAEILGINRKTLREKRRKYGIE
jgi:DNA-binding NtrC family response regulator